MTIIEETEVKLAINKNIARITLNRPHVHNALNLALVDSMLEMLHQLNNDSSIRIIILQATGENFCTGADLNWMRQATTTPQFDDDSIALKLANLMSTLYHLNKPTIALVQGAVMGGGIGLVCCCDIVLATPESHFCFSEIRLGLIPAVISPYVINAIKSRAARRYFLSAEKISAEKALSLGLVHELVPQEQWQNNINKLSAHFNAAAPHAMALTKQMINDIARHELDGKLSDITTEWLVKAQSSPEAKEGINAFFEKRPASWINTDQELL